MDYAHFHEKFPEIAVRETRAVTLRGHENMPDGEYSMLEMFCDQPGCDCRRVMIAVHRPYALHPLAVVNYGWESTAFYARWFGHNNPEIIREMQGPGLNSISRQSPLALPLLEIVQALLQDGNNVPRVKRHYQMFKQVVDQEAGIKKQPRRMQKRR